MHELGVVFHIIDKLKSVAEENDVTSVSSVTLELGEVSSVIPEYLQDCWKWAAAKHEFLKDAELRIETLPAVTFCEDCEKTYPTVPNGRICPHCGSPHTYLVCGNEFNIKEIEAC